MGAGFAFVVFARAATVREDRSRVGRRIGCRGEADFGTVLAAVADGVGNYTDETKNRDCSTIPLLLQIDVLQMPS